MATSTASKNAKKTPKNRARREGPRNYWKRPAEPLAFGNEQWRLTLIRRDKGNVRIDDFAGNIAWEDATVTLTGSISVEYPGKGDRFDLREGDLTICEVSQRGKGNWSECWRMRVESTSSNPGTESADLTDELTWLGRSRGDFSYKKGTGKGKRRKGWRANEITRDVCRKWGIRVGKLPKCSRLIDNLTETDKSPVDVILAAWNKEREETGKRFIVRMRKGRLEVVQQRRNRYMLLLGDTLLDASISRRLNDDLYTVAEATGTVERKGNRKGKVETRVQSKAKKQYGMIRRPFKVDESVHAVVNIRRRARRDMAKKLKQTREVTFTHPGIPYLRRGDSMRLDLSEMGFKRIVFAKTISHSVSAGDYTMDVTVGFNDPHRDKEGEKIRNKRCQKARERGRKLPADCRNLERDFAAPKRKRARS